MFGHLGAKVGEQGRKMQQLSEKKIRFLEAWRGRRRGGTNDTCNHIENVSKIMESRGQEGSK
jgi:hypothetical protein